MGELGFKKSSNLIFPTGNLQSKAPNPASGHEPAVNSK